MQPDSAHTQPISLPDIPALALSATQAVMLSADGEIKTLGHDQAQMVLNKKHVLTCHAPYTRSRLQLDEFYPFDVLELFVFVHPTLFTVPTIPGLCKALGLAAPKTLEDQPFSLIEITRALLSDLQNDTLKDKADPLKIAEVMGMNGKAWPWTSYIFSALGESYEESIPLNPRAAFNIWKKLPEWAEEAPEPPPSHHSVSAEEAQSRLQSLLGPGAEERPQQMDYTAQIASIFDPPQDDQPPHMVLAEAGTGTGKTLGYLAPASIWAEKNKGAVWISTYTKNLQRQIDQELDRLYPDPDLKDIHVATRKGRENYLCLLNLEDLSAGVQTARSFNNVISSGIMARWAAATSDGDLTGADFPGWLPGLLGWQNTSGLADRRGECIYSACDYYHRCFVERSVRKAERARLVVANHALVMIRAAMSSAEDDLPARYIFDEGHHLFSAADSAFAAHLSARETRDLRRWILGGEGGRKSRARGLKRRIEDLLAGDDEALKLLEDICHHTGALTMDGWTKRLKEGAPQGPTEAFFKDIYAQVHARANGNEGPYSLETELGPIDPPVLESALKLRSALHQIRVPMTKLATLMRKKLAADEGMMDSDTRKRMDSSASALEQRALMNLSAWIDMLDHLPDHAKAPSTEFVDWLEIQRVDGQAVDIGYFRHHIDPMRPFARTLTPHAHGMAVTSATLRDGTEDEEANWLMAEEQSGANYISPNPARANIPSPFDYAARSKVFVIQDVNKNDLAQVAGAYRVLFSASQGGALGLFTAISRLRRVHENIAADLDHNGLPLYAQHVDEMDTGSLVDIFRDDPASCLLGTDAVRDGVDVPGDSLRLIVFDRVPWPRPTILHKARRAAFGQGKEVQGPNKGSGRRYDEMLTRMKLKQAFGRLLRREDDWGAFVMLDSMLPSRLYGAFPEGTEIVKCGLSEACAEIEKMRKSYGTA